MKRRIRVTQANLAKGARQNEFGCPIACALHRVFPHTYVEVCQSTITVGQRTVAMSRRLEHLVRDFDAGASQQPYSFTLVL